MNNEEFPIQPYTIKQLAARYNCSTWTFRKWLTPIQSILGERMGHFYTPSQVRIIVGHLGAPFITFFVSIAEMMVTVAEALFGVTDADHYHADHQDQDKHSDDIPFDDDSIDQLDDDGYGTTIIT